MELNEAQLYNLCNSGGKNYSGEIQFLIRQLALHLKAEHGFGKRQIAKRLGIKMKQVDKILTTDEDDDRLELC